jgi:hypothetical protein
MRLANQLVTGETADLNEWFIAVKNITAEVCSRDQFLLC